MPKGQVNSPWSSEKGKWSLKLEDGFNDSPIDPVSSLLGRQDTVLPVGFDDFAGNKVLRRGVPAKSLQFSYGTLLVTTVFDLLMAQVDVSRGLPGDCPRVYDEDVPFTPAWQEKFTGISRDTVIRLAREFAHDAEVTRGRSMNIVGASVNHWVQNNLIYRAANYALILCGCCGRNGGGMNHYVGQEKVDVDRPLDKHGLCPQLGGAATTTAVTTLALHQ